MKNNSEIEKLETISGSYLSDALAGANEQYHLAVRDSLIPEKGGESALELGCGKGLWTELLCRRYAQVDVVEGSCNLLDKVLGKCSTDRAELAIHHKLIEDFLTSTDRHWQHIYMTFLLEHLNDPVAVLSLIAERLEEGGQLFIAVPNAESVHRMIALKMGLIASIDELSENDRLVGHRHLYTAELLRRQLHDAGLNVCDWKTVGLKPLSLGQMADWSPELVGAFCESADLCSGHGAYLTVTASR